MRPTGADTLNGGKGNDDLFGGNGPDDMFANGGDDYINAADKRPNETVDCGPGEDEAVVDGETEFDFFFPIAFPTDDVVGCERVFVAAFGFPGLILLSENEVPQAVEEGALEEAQ